MSHEILQIIVQSVISILFLVSFSLSGVLFRRVAGGLPPSFPRPIDQLNFCSGLGLLLYLVVPDTLTGQSVGLLAFILSVAGCCLGLGSWMDLTRSGKLDNEWAAGFLDLIFGKDTGYNLTRERVGLMLSGLIINIAPAIVVGYYLSIWAAMLVIAAGLFRVVAYEMGFFFAEKRPTWKPFGLNSYFNTGTEFGEGFTGIFQYFFTGLVIVIWFMW